MNTKFTVILFYVLISVSSCKQQENNEMKDITPINNTPTLEHDIKMYPKIENNLQHLISLPILEDEDHHKVEIVVGKTLEVDCNTHRLSGAFTEKDVSGWGYPYYKFETNGAISSTMKACLDEKKYSKFIKSSSEILRYNSKLPIVIYTPKDYEVRYYIWTKEDDEKTATINK